MRTPGRVWRIGVTALLADMALYLVWVAIPYKAISLGAGAASLGLLPTIASLTYVLTTLLAGTLSDRVSRLQVVRFGAVMFAVGCLLVMRAESLGGLLARLPMVGFGMGCFWPPIQAALADEGELSVLERNVGLFNVFWSAGKALGFLLGGSLYASFGAMPVFLIASGTMLLVAVVLPRPRPGAGAPVRPGADAPVRSGADAPVRPGAPVEPRASLRPEASPEPKASVRQQVAGKLGVFGRPRAPGQPEIAKAYERVSPRDLRALLYMAWLANAVAFGVGNTMNIQYPKFLLSLGCDAETFGVHLGIIFAAQTFTFLWLRGFHGWRFRRGPLYAVQGAMAVCACLLPLLRAFPLIFLTALPIGLGLGTTYHASITYSLVDRGARGRRAGFHEALLGAGNFLLPLLGGLLASAVSDLRVPYWFCGFAVLVGLFAQEMIWRRTRVHARA